MLIWFLVTRGTLTRYYMKRLWYFTTVVRYLVFASMQDARQMEFAKLAKWVGANDIWQLRFGNNVLPFVDAKNALYAFPCCLLAYNGLFVLTKRRKERLTEQRNKQYLSLFISLFSPIAIVDRTHDGNANCIEVLAVIDFI